MTLKLNTLNTKACYLGGRSVSKIFFGRHLVFDNTQGGEDEEQWEEVTMTSTLKPISGSGTSWNNIANCYDTSTTTAGTVSIRSNNYSSRSATFNMDLSSISGKSVTSAKLIINGKASADDGITLVVKLNSITQVISQALTTTAKDFTVDIMGYIDSLSSIQIASTSSRSSSTTQSIYDIRVEVAWVEMRPVEKPPTYEEDLYPLLGKGVGYRPVKDGALVSDGIIVSSESELDEAVSSAKAGQTIYVRGGDYYLGFLEISCSGEPNAPITIKNYPNEKPNLVDTRIEFSSYTNYVNFEGFVIRDLRGEWIQCVTVYGGCSYINIKNNEFYNIDGADEGANVIMAYGTKTTPISNCTIENNYIHDCRVYQSEVITFGSNVENCKVIQNTISNCDSIGIYLAGNNDWGEQEEGIPATSNQTRFVTVSRNLITKVGKFGIFCEGSRDNTIEYNVCFDCGNGVIIHSTDSGATSENFIVRNNLLMDCGGTIYVSRYSDSTSTLQNVYIYNNTLIGFDGGAENYGFSVGYVSNIEFFNNIVYGDPNFTFIYSNSSTGVSCGYNLYYKSGGSLPSGETNSRFADPQFVNNTRDLTGNYTVAENSQAINNGISSDKSGNLDLLGENRNNGTIDIGAYERQ